MSSISPKAAKILGYAGLIPFLGGAGLAAFGSPDVAAYAGHITKLYGALILSFLGGINWGFYVLADDKDKSADMLIMGVLPSLIALFGLSFGGAIGLLSILAGFLVILMDHLALGAKLAYPAWFMPLRRVLTIGAMLSLASLLL